MIDEDYMSNLFDEVLNQVVTTNSLSALTDIVPALYPEEHECLISHVFWTSLKSHLFWVAEDLIKLGFKLDPEETWRQGSLEDAIEMLGDDVIVVSWLLDHHAEIERRNVDVGNATPLMAAVGRQYLGITKLLLERGANPNATTLIDNNDTSLIIATTVKSKEAIRMLIEFGAEQSHRNRQGLTALDIARKSEDLDLIKLFRGPERSGLV